MSRRTGLILQRPRAAGYPVPGSPVSAGSAGLALASPATVQLLGQSGALHRLAGTSPPQAGYAYRYARWRYNEGAGNSIVAESNAFAIPDFVFGGTLGWAVPGALTTAAAGNVMTKVYLDAQVDALFRTDDLLVQPDYKVKFAYARLRPNTLPAAASRIFQYGDQGSAQLSGTPQKGGWVARFNGAGSAAPFNEYCATFAIHTPYNLAMGNKVGGQSDPNFVDPIITDPTPIVVGTTYDYVFAIDASRNDGNYYAMIYRDAGFVAEDVSFDPVNYSLPGISDVTINGSSGLRLFSQSDATGQSPLKDFTVYEFMVGEAANTAHLAAIVAALHADPSANPY